MQSTEQLTPLHRPCTSCGEQVKPQQHAVISASGTRHLGGCPGVGTDEATDRMRRAFAATNVRAGSPHYEALAAEVAPLVEAMQR